MQHIAAQEEEEEAQCLFLSRAGSGGKAKFFKLSQTNNSQS